MIELFSNYIPSEMVSDENCDTYLPFKHFVIETSVVKPFGPFFPSDCNITNQPVPECYSCSLHYSIASYIHENFWKCSFCGKENQISEIKKVKKFNKEAFFLEKFPSMHRTETETESLFDSNIARLRNAVVLIVDYGVLMNTFSYKPQKSQENLTLKQSLYTKMKDQLKDYPLTGKFVMLLCGAKISVLTNKKSDIPAVVPPKYDDVKKIFQKYFVLSKSLFDEDFFLSQELVIERFSESEPYGLSSIGAGFSMALGILEGLNPRNPKIIFIGQGDSYFGACRNIDFELDRSSECEKGLQFLFQNYKKSKDITIEVLCTEERKNQQERNFFGLLEKTFKENVTYLKSFDSISLRPPSESKTTSAILRVSSSPELTIVPAENLDYHFTEKKHVLKMEDVSLERNLYPFHFEFAAGKTSVEDNDDVFIQAELIIRKDSSVWAYVTTKKLRIVRMQNIKAESMNFSVVAYCYWINNYLCKEYRKFIKGLKALIEFYLKKKGKNQIEYLRSLQYEIKTRKLEFDLEGLVPEARTKNFNFNKIVRTPNP